MSRVVARTQCANHPMESYYVSAARCQSAVSLCTCSCSFPYGRPTASSGSGCHSIYHFTLLVYKWVVWLCAHVYFFSARLAHRTENEEVCTRRGRFLSRPIRIIPFAEWPNTIIVDNRRAMGNMRQVLRAIIKAYGYKVSCSEVSRRTPPQRIGQRRCHATIELYINCMPMCVDIHIKISIS